MYFSLSTILLVLLSLLHIATTAVLPQELTARNELTARAPQIRPLVITVPEFATFLDQHYPDSSKYAFSMYGADDQLEHYTAANPDVISNEEILFHDSKLMEAFPHIFHVDTQQPIGRLTIAMATRATGRVQVFGAIKYQERPNSVYTKAYYDLGLKPGLESGRLEAIEHMAPWATEPNQIMAIEKSPGVLEFQDGYSEGQNNLGPRPISKPNPVSNPNPDGGADNQGSGTKRPVDGGDDGGPSKKPNIGDDPPSDNPYGDPASTNPKDGGSTAPDSPPATGDSPPATGDPSEGPHPADPDIGMPDIHI